jgi:hypothetical protein
LNESRMALGGSAAKGRLPIVVARRARWGRGGAVDIAKALHSRQYRMVKRSQALIYNDCIVRVKADRIPAASC